jgi:hypothetical protein
MVVEVEADLQQRQVFLVAEVMRRQLTPIKGVGVRWLRAVGLDTEKSLLTFVEHHLRLAPGSIRGTARFAPGPGERPVIDFEARVLRVMTRAAQEAELAMLMSRSVAPAVEVDDAAFDPPPGVPPPIPEDTVEDMPEVLEQEATDGLGMRRLDTEIFYRFGGQQHRGILRFASSMRFVLDSSSPLTGRNGRLYVEWNDRGGAGGVVLRGEVEREILSPSGTWRVEARITALSEGGRPGLYREYLIKYGV